MRSFSKIIILALLFCNFITKDIYAQKKWTQEIFAKANTAKDLDYLTDKEKWVVFYYNLVRLEPALFMDTYVDHYIDSTRKHNKYTSSLKKTLKDIEKMDVLYPSPQLYQFAKVHALDFGKSGKTGHGNFKKRFQEYSAKCHCRIGENCYYGNSDALNIVICLLIDENVSNLGHRKNILNPEFKNIGVSIAKHKTYKWNCVMDFDSGPM
ncbi:MAG: CAP domain-containing protein [Bacteroidota bacterium]